MSAYARPASLREALRLRAQGAGAVLAGGTDYYADPARGSGDVLDITAVRGLAGIARAPGGWRIGAATTWREILDARLPRAFDALKLAAREVGGPQIQNAGTVGGNLCNASPAADGVPALLALEAQVELAGTGGRRVLPLLEFILGPRRTDLRPDELLIAVRVPDPGNGARGAFLKLGARRHLVISIASAAACLTVRSGLVVRASVAVGACSAVPARLTHLESELRGAMLAQFRVRAEHLDGLAPIDDVRASAPYRREAARELVQRLLASLA